MAHAMADDYLIPRNDAAEATRDPEGPARRLQHHVRDRFLSAGAGAKKGWVAKHPLLSCYDKGQLEDKPAPKETDGETRRRLDRARDRLSAGEEYTELWDKSQVRYPGIDMNAPGGGSATSRIPYSEVQANASRRIIAIKARMGERDREIVDMVCGRGHTPAEAISTIYGPDPYRHVVMARFREALDALIEALR